MSGFDIIEIKSNAKGQVDIDALKAVLDKDVAAIMMTNPNTLGILKNKLKKFLKSCTKMAHCCIMMAQISMQLWDIQTQNLWDLMLCT